MQNRINTECAYVFNVKFGVLMRFNRFGLAKAFHSRHMRIIRSVLTWFNHQLFNHWWYNINLKKAFRKCYNLFVLQKNWSRETKQKTKHSISRKSCLSVQFVIFLFAWTTCFFLSFYVVLLLLFLVFVRSFVPFVRIQ